MAKPVKKALTISTCLLVAVALTIGAVAWFAGYKVIGNMGFQTGSNANLPDMKMWMYYSENDVVNAPEGSAETEGWIEQTVTDDPTGKNEYIVIPGAGEETQDSTDSNGDPITLYTYEIPKLHFGKVDNLVTLKNDNKVLLRFYFDDTMLNNPDGIIHYVAFTLAYNTEGYTYDVGKESVLDSIHLLKEVQGGSQEVDLREDRGNGKHVLEYRTDEPRAMQFLQIRYAVSNDVYEPVGDGFGRTVTVQGETTTTTEMLTLSDPLPINCGSGGAFKPGSTTEYICDKCHAGTCGQVRLNDADLKKVCTATTVGETTTYTFTKDANGNCKGFYVYIEMAPLLDAFGMQENILDYFVPAYMFFDAKMDVEIG